ncbi:uncharacterized protein BDW70DRAFT_128340 [Aspergillus foveolatus]|uniref:uncharacterized protein n=1 Tax=Aspergillus foveolatus TaxID=210207 RepID=UPI003CCCDCDF
MTRPLQVHYYAFSCSLGGLQRLLLLCSCFPSSTSLLWATNVCGCGAESKPFSIHRRYAGHIAENRELHSVLSWHIEVIQLVNG